jgi:hypothetical protein
MREGYLLLNQYLPPYDFSPLAYSLELHQVVDESIEQSRVRCLPPDME